MDKSKEKNMFEYHAAFIFLPITKSSHLFTAMPLAPALLKGICDSHGLKTTTIDLDIELKHERQKKYFNTEIEKYLMFFHPMSEEAYDWYHNWVEKTARRLIKMNCNWLGLSLLSYQSLAFAQDICFWIKKLKPTQKIILGGAGISQDDNTGKTYKNNKKMSDIMLETGLCDTVIINESENLLIDVLLQNRKGKLDSKRQLSQAELNQLPTPSYIDYKIDLYGQNESNFKLEKHIAAATITGSKGCVRRCTFCDVFTFEPKFVFKDGRKIADEMIEIYETQGIKSFHFSDSLINGSMKAFRQMNEHLVKKLPKTISYLGEYIARPIGQTTDEDYHLMAEAGCKHVVVGVESGSEQVRNHMKKKFTNNDLFHMIESLYKVGITQQWNLMVGYVTETRKDFEETLNLVQRYKHIKYPNILANPGNILSLLPGTPLADTHARQLEIEWEDVKEGVGMMGSVWKSPKNPENTFENRIKWWLELIELCKENNFITPQRYENKKAMAKMMLLHWNQTKKKNAYS